MGKTIKTSASGRKCMFLHCKCILSIYNHEAYCHVHRGRVPQEQISKISGHLEVQTTPRLLL